MLKLHTKQNVTHCKFQQYENIPPQFLKLHGQEILWTFTFVKVLNLKANCFNNKFPCLLWKHISKCLHFFYNFIFYNLIFELVQQSTKYNLHYATSLKSLKANIFPFKKINLYVNYHISFYSPKYFSMQIFSVWILTVPEPSQHALFLIVPIFSFHQLQDFPSERKKVKLPRQKNLNIFSFMYILLKCM